MATPGEVWLRVRAWLRPHARDLLVFAAACVGATLALLWVNATLGFAGWPVQVAALALVLAGLALAVAVVARLERPQVALAFVVVPLVLLVAVTAAHHAASKGMVRPNPFYPSETDDGPESGPLAWVSYGAAAASLLFPLHRPRAQQWASFGLFASLFAVASIVAHGILEVSPGAREEMGVAALAHDDSIGPAFFALLAGVLAEGVHASTRRSGWRWLAAAALIVPVAYASWMVLRPPVFVAHLDPLLVWLVLSLGGLRLLLGRPPADDTQTGLGGPPGPGPDACPFDGQPNPGPER